RLNAARRPPFVFEPAHAGHFMAQGVELRAATPEPGAQPLTPTARPHSPNAQHPRPRRIVIFGAGGPLAAAAARMLAPDYQLRLTDRGATKYIPREGSGQWRTARLPDPLPPPHEMRIVDVTDARQVSDACEGTDAIINCTVMREDPVEAFRVNTLGAYHIA